MIRAVQIALIELFAMGGLIYVRYSIARFFCRIGLAAGATACKFVPKGHPQRTYLEGRLALSRERILKSVLRP